MAGPIVSLAQADSIPRRERLPRHRAGPAWLRALRSPGGNPRRPTQQLDGALRTYSQDHLEISAMDLRLQGKRALVTGSSIGLGAASASALAAEGVAVATHGRPTTRTYAAAGDLHEPSGRVGSLFSECEIPVVFY